MTKKNDAEVRLSFKESVFLGSIVMASLIGFTWTAWRVLPWAWNVGSAIYEFGSDTNNSPTALRDELQARQDRIDVLEDRVNALEDFEACGRGKRRTTQLFSVASTSAMRVEQGCEPIE